MKHRCPRAVQSPKGRSTVRGRRLFLTCACEEQRSRPLRCTSPVVLNTLHFRGNGTRYCSFYDLLPMSKRTIDLTVWCPIIPIRYIDAKPSLLSSAKFPSMSCYVPLVLHHLLPWLMSLVLCPFFFRVEKSYRSKKRTLSSILPVVCRKVPVRSAVSWCRSLFLNWVSGN
jgi:hypothetical protein